MPRIFISYRRSDSKVITSRIYDRLVTAFDRDNIFKDVDNIPPGRDFRGVLREATADCQVMLVVIGPNWINATDANNNRRLDDANDFVRIEVESGLQRDEVLVIPLLVEGAQMPSPSQLPDALRELAYNNAFTIHDDPVFHNDMQVLIKYLQGILRPKRLRPVRRPSNLILVAALLTLIVVVLILLPVITPILHGSNIAIPSATQANVIFAPTDTPTETSSPEPTPIPTFTGTSIEQITTSRPTPTPVASGYVWRSTDAIRGAASTYSAPVATVSSGEPVKVYYPISIYPESTNWWLYVELQNSGGKAFGFIPWSSVNLYSDQTLVLASRTPTLTPTPSQ